MSSPLRNDNYKFYQAAGVTASENSNAVDIGGARGFSILVTLADNGSGAGSVALEGSLDGTNFVELAGTSTTISFLASAQKILFTVTDPMYKYVRIALTVSAGDMDIDGEVTIIEGAS
jgi:hypothetical protein